MDEMKLRELRKLVEILSTWGNVLVPGGKNAYERMVEITEEFTSAGYSYEDMDSAMANLN